MQSINVFNPKISVLKISKYFIYYFATILNAKYLTAMGCEICLQFEFEKFSIALRSGCMRLYLSDRKAPLRDRVDAKMIMAKK